MDGIINQPLTSLPSLDLVCTTLGSPCGFKARLPLPTTTTTTANLFLAPPTHNYNLRPRPHRNLATSAPLPTPTASESTTSTSTYMPCTPPRHVLVPPTPQLWLTPAFTLRRDTTTVTMASVSSQSSGSASSMDTDGECMDFEYLSDDEEMEDV